MPPSTAASDQPQGGRLRAGFVAGLPFELDRFQALAFDALDAGRSVVVAAPTGSGKTVVAEYAVARALGEGGKAFYTTPLKALSNQKYADFSRRLGAASVGLLTGDNSINGDAPVVVMTTEVLRNMVYAGSPALAGLRYVVLDEVHYLQDPYRGPVWEEVIIHLAPEVDLVCLSATVSNAEELADWVGTVRGSTAAVIEDRRPVPLRDLLLLGERPRLPEAGAGAALGKGPQARPGGRSGRRGRLALLPTFVDGRPNPEAVALTANSRVGWRGRRRSSVFAPRRSETVELLADAGMLPAIYFIFSRAGCDEALRQCVHESPPLTNAQERRRARAIAGAATAPLSGPDLLALGHTEWLAALEAGFAAHHAGMVPPFKEAVERCFASGLVKVVFATETLALGVNMPARSVVIEKLVKFGGERLEPLTPGEYTQLTGRAGRRGTDEVGYAVVSWSPGVEAEQVAELAGARSYTLSSSFRPTYNMAANLVRRYTPEHAHHLLNLSFAQYRADADTVRLEAHLERARRELVEASAGATCELGDVFEYMRSLHPGEPARPSRTASAQVVAALERLRPGDVLAVPAGRRGGRRGDGEVAVLSTSQRKRGELSLRAITAERRLVSYSSRDFRSPPRVLGRLELPLPFAPRSRDFQRRVAAGLVVARGLSDGERAPKAGGAPAEAGHPVSACPELRAHLRAAARCDRLARQVERLERQATRRSESLARQFDRVLGLLERWRYVKGWALTPAGERLARLYHEQDLLVAECVERGLLDGLPAADMAGLASVFTYEPRAAGPSVLAAGRQGPGQRLRERWAGVEAVAAELAADEEAFGLPRTRPPDPGFVALARAWAKGRELGKLVGGVGPQAEPLAAGAGAWISPGDFVRNTKQLIDLLRQLGQIMPDTVAAGTARQASGALFHGVVAASSVVGNEGAGA